MSESVQFPTSEFNPPLRMLWAELTQSCNEHCGHCYNDSGAHRAGEETLGAEDWFRILADARRSGASDVQFIGGEPTLVPWLENALLEAKRLGFASIEIYTNGTRLSDSLISVCAQNGVHVAVSIYSHEPAVHDRITMLEGSHERTVHALQRLLRAGVPTRGAVVRVPANRDQCEATVAFVRELGVENVGIDDARAFGRAQALVGRKPEMSELCGHCWNGTLCVDPQGRVSPCIMSRHMVVGDVRESSLADIVASAQLAETRRGIYEQVWTPRQVSACTPNSPNPPAPCFPASTQGNPCGPHTCGPGTGPCYPLGTKRTEQDLCLPGADAATAALVGGVSEAASAVRELVSAGQVTACLPNSPNPPAPCFPSSTPQNPCGPHTCGPGNQPCYPLGK